MRNLGLDIGDKRVGVAMSDPDEILASPLMTITRTDDARVLGDILKLINTYEIKRLIVGLPYSLDGSHSAQTLKTEDFIQKLSVVTGVEVVPQDERLSTVTSSRLLAGAGIKKSRRKELMDAATAAVILQHYLDTQKTSDQVNKIL